MNDEHLYPPDPQRPAPAHPPTAHPAGPPAAAQPIPAQPHPGQPSAPQLPTAAAPIAHAQAQPIPAPRPLPAGNRPAASVGGRPIPVAVVETTPGAVRTAQPASENPEEEEDAELASFVKNSPPWLVSMVVHMLLLIVLGLWVFAVQHKPKVELEIRYAEELGEQLEEESFELTADDQVEIEEQVITPDNLPPVDDPFAAPADVPITFDATHATSKVAAPMVGLALSGREKGSKSALLAAYGGNALTEKAVLEGLRWLARNQESNGSWSLVGPYADGAVNENRVAATAMALLAFQGAGHTHVGGERTEFGRVVARGWYWLLKQQDADGNFFHQGPAHHRLYTQAQCTIAICELNGMVRDPEAIKSFRKPGELAVKYAIRTQDSAGGWRYTPGSDSDTSVTGWFMMALQSAKMAGYDVPDDTFKRISRYLDRAQEDGGRHYLYKPGSHGGPAMTAEGLLCRQYLGWKQDDPRLRDGARYLTRNLIRWNDKNSYYWYYATQVCHHMEGDYWKAWNKVMRQLLPEKQEKSGRERGSWDPTGDAWESHGGRLMHTCLCIYMLEVYYRHLPIYQKAAFMQHSLGE